MAELVESRAMGPLCCGTGMACYGMGFEVALNNGGSAGGAETEVREQCHLV